MTSWLVVTRLRPGRSGRSCGEEITCDDRDDRAVDRPVRTPAPRAGADFAAVRDGADLAGWRVVAPALRADALFVVRPAAELRAAVAFGAAFRGAAFLAPVVLFRAALVVLFRAAAVDLRAVPVVAFRPGAARFAGAAFARPGAVRLDAVRPDAAALAPDALVALARPAGPLLRRAAPPDRSVFTSVFTNSGLRSAEMPETPYLRSWPRMSSTRIREISDSEIRGVFGV
nr:hypothetical protein [Micromonospora endophytica]